MVILKSFLMNIFVPHDPLNTSYMLKIESKKLFFDMIHPPRLMKDLVTVRLWAITVLFAKIFCPSEITSVICMKNWFYVQNFGMIVNREGGYAKKWQN